MTIITFSLWYERLKSQDIQAKFWVLPTNYQRLSLLQYVSTHTNFSNLAITSRVNLVVSYMQRMRRESHDPMTRVKELTRRRASCMHLLHALTETDQITSNLYRIFSTNFSTWENFWKKKTGVQHIHFSCFRKNFRGSLKRKNWGYKTVSEARWMNEEIPHPTKTKKSRSRRRTRKCWFGTQHVYLPSLPWSCSARWELGSGSAAR